MSKTVGDFVVDRLAEWGVKRIFGYPGDGVNGLLAGLQRFGTDRMQFVQVRHEEMAAFEAVGYAKFSGRVGVCIATSGPGATNLVTAIADAHMDSIPMVAITGISSIASVRLISSGLTLVTAPTKPSAGSCACVATPATTKITATATAPPVPTGTTRPPVRLPSAR